MPATQKTAINNITNSNKRLTFVAVAAATDISMVMILKLTVVSMRK
jgi:hypothetical protein